VATAVTWAALGAAVAGAHVTVQPGTQKKGASDVLVTFAVPNEVATAQVTAFEVDFPADTPLLGVHAQAIPGWTAAVETTKLAKPVTTDDGQITEAVSKITWTVTDPADAIGPDQFGGFTVLVGTLPKTTSKVVFKALQTYSDGTVVSWIEPVVKGTPAPEHPTPILKLAGKA
jgi:periplasmic copper chaperone A